MFRFISPKLGRDFQAATKRRLAESCNDSVNWEQRQLEFLRPIWDNAVTDIPYYSDLVAAGNAPKKIVSWDDFYALPVLSRQILQKQPNSFVRRSGPPDDFVKTAGSTGTPLKLGQNRAERDQMRIVKLAEWQQFGYKPNSRLFLIWGHSHLLGTGWRRSFNHLRRKSADWLLGYCRVDAYCLNRQSCEQYAKQLVRFRPHGIIGYASALDLFARYTVPFRDRFHALDLRFVLATSEPPPQTDTFSRLEAHFDCPVVQEYGGAEFGQVAFQSGTAHFDVYSDLNFLECAATNTDPPDAHSALVTTLYPRYVPLIRYRVGDALTRPERLAHGHVTRFAGVAGRLNDMIKLENGDAIHSVAVFHCVHQERSVHNVQMVVSDDGIEIRLVNSASRDKALEDRIRKRLGQVHPMLGKARIVSVEDLETNPAGKRRWYIDQRSKAPARVSSV